jgi:alpha-L-fucosidase
MNMRTTIALLLLLLTTTSVRAVDIPAGPFRPTWESVRENYKVPAWFGEAKFGIFIHWGLYAVPAHHNEWYARHMYSNPQIAKWHAENFGPQDKFGYKEFIPLFKAEKYDPAAWAEVFEASGAKYVIPVAEHHDGFAMYDSALTKWCAGKMGPKRDLIGELASAVRQCGLKFGVSSHRMEHHTFMYPTLKDLKHDQFDPQFADFYGPPIPGHMNDANASPEFQADWLARCAELVDKYQPDMFWFDNGINDRAYDPVKLKFAAYYYNRAAEWKKPVSISTKEEAYLAGSIRDFEKASRGPKEIRDHEPWQIDDVISDRSWGYVSNMKYRSPASVLHELIDTVSKGGNLLLNISPKADGTIPDEQQQILRAVGAWLTTNGEAIYGTKPWTKFGEGKVRYTTKGDALYAIFLDWPGDEAIVPAVAGDATVTLLGHDRTLQSSKDGDRLRVKMPEKKAGELAYVLKIDRVATAVAVTAAATIPATANAPLTGYAKKLPEGNYLVTITFGRDDSASETTVKAESRRLMLERVPAAAGESVTRKFAVNIRTPKLPGGGGVRINAREKEALHWDDQLSLEFLGENAAVRSVDVAPAPSETITVYLASDSTVTDQPNEPWAGWGQMLPRFFKPSVAVANHAESGRALSSFRAEKRLDKILGTIKPGDYLFIQFGHNDVKEKGDGVGAFTSYKQRLRQFVAAARERGAHPVVLTSMHRRRFDESGKVVNTFGDYIEAARQAAAEENVPLIDLNAMSQKLYESWGPELSKSAFVHYPANTFPGQDKPLKDDTHHNVYGGYELAKCVVDGIRVAKLPLADHLVDDVKPFDPSKPDAIESVNIPPSPLRKTATPEGR